MARSIPPLKPTAKNQIHHVPMKTISGRIPASLLALSACALATATLSAGTEKTFELLIPPQMPAGDSCNAYAINNLGQILIDAWNPNTGATDGYYLYDSLRHEFSTLPSDPDAMPGITTTFYGLNDLGEFTGQEPSTTRAIPDWASTLGYEAYNAFTYSSKTKAFTNFMPTTAGAFVSGAIGINDEGVIVGINNTGSGDQGWVLRDHTFTTLDVFPTGPNVETGIPSGPTTDPQAINNLGDIVGYFSNPAGNITSGAFRYDGITHKITILNTGTSISQAYGVNDEGEVVGYMTNDPTEYTGNGFLLAGDHVVAITYPGAVYTGANAINDFDQVVGQYYDAAGVSHAFLIVLTPPFNDGNPPRPLLK
jgi:uncharacterized membrane protein